MNNKLRASLLSITLFSLLFNYGCNKDQRYVNNLSGEWEATEMTVTDGGSSETYYKSDTFSLEFNFQNCKLKEDDWCSYSGSQILSGDTFNWSGIYKSDIDSDKVNISGNGTVLILTEPDHIEEEGYTSRYIISLYEKNSVLLMSSVNGDISLRFERLDN
ncbi:MAG: hypothetical protein ACI8XB_002045 [Patiriisocius sp.]|jgi:hypothetical protein